MRMQKRYALPAGGLEVGAAAALNGLAQYRLLNGRLCVILELPDTSAHFV